MVYGKYMVNISIVTIVIYGVANSKYMVNISIVTIDIYGLW